MSTRTKPNSNMPEILSQEPKPRTRSNQSEKPVYRIEPLTDPRWEGFVDSHSSGSVFHSTAWLETLRRTYGYEPVAYTQSAPDEDLHDSLLFCRVESWLTGARLVSLPFSDYCEPLLRTTGDLPVLLRRARQDSDAARMRYLEIRPQEPHATTLPELQATAKYTLHRLNLRADLPTLFRSLHKDSVQRKIKRATREGLTCQAGTSESILDAFYRLLIITRRRHGVPPQPKIWFRNLIECFGPGLQICVAFKDRRPIAGMLTLRHKNTLYYKYGGSDVRFNKLGSMHCLYWESIQRAKALGIETFDLGRSDLDQPGLITFKTRWGATRTDLTYFRYSGSENPTHWFESWRPTWKTRFAKNVLAHTPRYVLAKLGALLYRHIG
jgi:CelD/BcsL family acetyltransferase involved in cellulose biosynthesis